MHHLLSHHIYNSDGLIRLSKYPSRETLMIHIRREETNRIVSAVKQVLNSDCGKNPHKLLNGTECILEEGPVVDAIASRTAEIGIAEHDLLNCKSYKALQENGPQLVVSTTNKWISCRLSLPNITALILNYPFMQTLQKRRA